MKYRLINLETGEEYLCQKIVIDGFDYYFKNERICKVGQFYIDDTNTIRQSITDNKFYWSKRLNYKIVIATNNPNIDIPKVVDNAETLAFEFYENAKKEYYSICQKAQLPKYEKEFRAMENGFIAGYKKFQETRPFSEDDMIEFANWIIDQDWSKIDMNCIFPKLKSTGKSTKKLLQLWKSQKPQTIYFK